ncbi:ankyrin repeat domain-containing protein [Ferrimonas aestuarii]|uniref:Ankyrin repeat domain-containing protein n=1 Tax=Ferrimonas aestuarii TaxID=2569539 RepID=A0A4U1BT35_9GAMM|nr:ankyrin repeat domain-containing protein [Ferrimonas aestuarii]TKB58332.1 ankyrin repeat domain-containing protein [Ferrimonas aestuarii]
MKLTPRGSLLTLVLSLLISFWAFSDDSLHGAAYHGDEALVIKLLATNPDPDARDSFGGTALHGAMFQDNLNIVRLLIDAGFDVNAIGPRNGYTPLHDAVWANNLEAAKLLVENGSRVDIRSRDGQTPLDKARAEAKFEMVKYLESVSAK